MSCHTNLISTDPAYRGTAHNRLPYTYLYFAIFPFNSLHRGLVNRGLMWLCRDLTSNNTMEIIS